MQKTSYYSGRIRRAKVILLGLLLTCSSFPTAVFSAQQSGLNETLSGHYSRDGNNGSPSETAGNSIYIKFFEDRWVGMLFIPFPYASGVEAPVVTQVFVAARKQTTSAALMKGEFGLLSEAATIQIERYGYLGDRIVFECGSLAPCTIRLGDGFLELIKPGVINEHIVRYNHVATP
jgi:hypothetical protein